MVLGKYSEKCTLDPEDTCDSALGLACDPKRSSKKCICKDTTKVYYEARGWCDWYG